MAEGTSGRRRFSDKWGKHELDVLAVLSSAFPQWLTSRQIAQRVKAYADSYGELADQAAKAAEGAARYLTKGKNTGGEIPTIPGQNVGYVVPGTLHTSDLPALVEFYFRVRKPIAKGTIRIRNGENVIRSIAKEHLIPSEMEQVLIAGKQLENAAGDITVEVVEEN